MRDKISKLDQSAGSAVRKQRDLGESAETPEASAGGPPPRYDRLEDSLVLCPVRDNQSEVAKAQGISAK